VIQQKNVDDNYCLITEKTLNDMFSKLHSTIIGHTIISISITSTIRLIYFFQNQVSFDITHMRVDQA
jgi:hypothetical protein